MDILGSNNEVDASYLADVIKAKCSEFLVIDTRSFLDYNAQHIHNSINAFYSKIIRFVDQHIYKISIKFYSQD